MNSNSALTAASGHRARNTPRAVATPLPPLNLSHTGKQCPSSTARAAIIIQVALSPVKRPASLTAAIPFAVSNTSVRTPASGPTTRATLVAPMFPLPDLRTSPPPNSFVRSSPKGIEPRRYAAKGISRKAIEFSTMLSQASGAANEKLSTVVYSAPERFSLLSIRWN